MTPDPSPAASRTNGVPLALRGAALILILLALLDPALTSTRNPNLVISVMALDGEERTRVSRTRVADRLEAHGTVASAGVPGAHATVLVGNDLPLEVLEDAWTLPEPVFMVRPDGEGRTGEAVTTPEILALRIPGRADPGSRIPVQALVRLPGRGGGDRPSSPLGLRAAMRTEGQLLAEAPLTPEGTADALEVRLEVVPPAPGALPLRLQVGNASVDALVQVEPRTWNVHVHDLRPSWKSTFVRRALEEDPRFRLTSRTATAPGTATAFGSAPASLTAPGALDGVELVAVGAPEGLAEAEVEALDTWVRERGGTLLLLADVELVGPVSRLVGVDAWTRLGSAESWALEDPDDRAAGSGAASDPEAPPRLRARSLLRPDVLPPGAHVHAATPSGDPGVWSRTLGQGTVLVSGALDSWHFRDPEASAFEAAWREWVAWGASRTPPLLELEWVHGSASGGARVGMAGGVGAGVVRPGGLARFQITLGPVPPEASPVQARARLGDRLLPLAPGLHPGSFQGWLYAPVEPGAHPIVVEVRRAGAPEEATLEAVLPLVVVADAAPAPPDPTALLESWVAARGGTLHADDDLGSLVAGIRAGVGAEGPAEPWHPMRSPWWILPLALALAGEWWWRRRRGLA